MVMATSVVLCYLLVVALTSGLLLLGVDSKWLMYRDSSTLASAITLVAVLWPVTLPIMAIAGIARLFMRLIIRKRGGYNDNE
jgi:hypothetical protein